MGGGRRKDRMGALWGGGGQERGGRQKKWGGRKPRPPFFGCFENPAMMTEEKLEALIFPFGGFEKFSQVVTTESLTTATLPIRFELYRQKVHLSNRQTVLCPTSQYNCAEALIQGVHIISKNFLSGLSRGNITLGPKFLPGLSRG